MSIEFRCTQCQRLLRTGDDAAGKQAQCPGCATVLTVPAAAGEVASGSAPPVLGAAPSPTGATPFGPSSPGATPFGSPWAEAASGGPQGPGGPVNPYQSPGDFHGSPSWLPAGPQAPVVPTILGLDGLFDLFGRTWTVFKDQYGMCLGLYLATIGLSLLANIVVQVIQLLTQATSHDPAVVAIVTMVVSLAAYVFGIWIGLGLLRGMISIARGQPTSVGVLFSGGPFLIPMILACLILGLIVAGILLVAAAIGGGVAYVGFQGVGNERWIAALVGTIVLAFIPLVVLFLMFSPFRCFIVDRNADALESLNLSRQITNGNKLILLLRNLLVSIVGGIVILATCFLGLFFAVGPYLELMAAMFYLAMSGQTTADQLRYESWQNPPPMPPFPSV
jgi:phage FluMu protein Com